MRFEEIEFAKQQIAKIPWVDKGRIILSGFSEGSQGVSNYSDAGFAAHILIGTDCRLSGGSPNAPDGTPVTNIVGSNDSFGYGGGCRVSRDAGGSKSLVIVSGKHDVSGEDKARKAIKEFLETCRSG